MTLLNSIRIGIFPVFKSPYAGVFHMLWGFTVKKKCEEKKLHQCPQSLDVVMQRNYMLVKTSHMLWLYWCIYSAIAQWRCIHNQVHVIMNLQVHFCYHLGKYSSSIFPSQQQYFLLLVWQLLIYEVMCWICLKQWVVPYEETELTIFVCMVFLKAAFQ